MSKKETFQKINSVEIENKINALKAFAIESESIEVHFNLNINPKMQDQALIHTCMLPNSIGKDVKVIAFVSDTSRASAIEAGADFIADEENILKIKNGKIFFDYCVASPDSMRLISTLAKILGPRGLMPNAKLGTLTTNFTDTIKSLKKGQVSIKNDRYGLVHVMIGKCNNSTSNVRENLEYLVDFVQSKKPQTMKGNLISTLYISTTMGPSILLS